MEIFRLHAARSILPATYAIPGGEARERQTAFASSDTVPLVDLIGIELPDRHSCDEVLESYFGAVHWFSLVIHEPRFRIRYERVLSTRRAHPQDFGFLLLLLMVLSLGCWYHSMKTNLSDRLRTELKLMHESFIRVVREHFMDIMDEDSLDFVQLCTLLGSFYLYHGRPRSSFSMLGAATKSAQAMGLHRDSKTTLAKDVTEERKRAWWTIYTWDRWVQYGCRNPVFLTDKQVCNSSLRPSIGYQRPGLRRVHARCCLRKCAFRSD